jgi:hypothetical protein
MFDYVDKIINAFDKAEPKGGSTKSSAAPDDLFNVDDDREKLPPEKVVDSQPGGQDTICHQTSQA